MAYSAADRLVAYGWYMHGLSFAKIKAKMRREYPGLKEATVAAWAKRYKWEKQRETHMQKALDAIGAGAADEQLKAAKVVDRIIDGLVDALAATEIKSHEGAAHALMKALGLAACSQGRWDDAGQRLGSMLEDSAPEWPEDADILRLSVMAQDRKSVV